MNLYDPVICPICSVVYELTFTSRMPHLFGRLDSGIGAGIDSYYEYLFKAYILFGDDTYFKVWMHETFVMSPPLHLAQSLWIERTSSVVIFIDMLETQRTPTSPTKNTPQMHCFHPPVHTCMLLYAL